MFRPLISLAIACVLASCSQQASSPGQAHAAELSVPATLIRTQAPEGWVVRQNPHVAQTGKVVVENGQIITELPPVHLVFVQGDQVAMDATSTTDL